MTEPDKRMRCKVSTGKSEFQDNPGMVSLVTDYEPADPDNIIQSQVQVAVDDKGYADSDLWATALRLAADKIDRTVTKV